MSYTSVALTFRVGRRRSPAHETLIDLFAERGVAAYRIQDECFACLRKIVLGESEARSDTTREEGGEALVPPSDTGEIGRVHLQPTAQFSQADALLRQQSRQGILERFVGPDLRHR